MVISDAIIRMGCCQKAAAHLEVHRYDNARFKDNYYNRLIETNAGITTDASTYLVCLNQDKIDQSIQRLKCKRFYGAINYYGEPINVIPAQ